MREPVTLGGGVLHDSGTFYLLVQTEDADEDEYVIATGRAFAGQIDLEQRTGLEEIVSIITLSERWALRGDAACLTAEGALYFIGPAATEAEIVPGSGYSRPDSRGIGRMAALREAGEWLFAFGFGGQVYRRRVDSGWEDISVPPSAGSSFGKPLFYTVAMGPTSGSFVFGGVNVSEYEDTDEIEQADEEGDADRLADLILDAVSPDTVTIRIYDGRWTENEFDSVGYIAPIIFDALSSWLVFVSTGSIWRTGDFDVFDEIFAKDEPQEQWGDVKEWEGRVLVLDDDALYVLNGNELEDFPDTLPSIGTKCLSVSPSTAGLAAIHEDLVQLLDGTGWIRLTPVMEQTA